MSEVFTLLVNSVPLCIHKNHLNELVEKTKALIPDYYQGTDVQKFAEYMMDIQKVFNDATAGAQEARNEPMLLRNLLYELHRNIFHAATSILIPMRCTGADLGGLNAKIDTVMDSLDVKSESDYLDSRYLPSPPSESSPRQAVFAAYIKTLNTLQSIDRADYHTNWCNGNCAQYYSENQRNLATTLKENPASIAKFLTALGEAICATPSTNMTAGELTKPPPPPLPPESPGSGPAARG